MAIDSATITELDRFCRDKSCFITLGRRYIGKTSYTVIKAVNCIRKEDD